MDRRGFTLLELAIVILLLSIVLAIGYGSLSRYRASLALSQAAERMTAELGNTKGQAQAFGLPHLRNNQPLPSPPPVAGTQQGDNSVQARIVEKIYGAQFPKVTKQWTIGDVGGQGKRLEVRFANLPLVPFNPNSSAEQGVALEVFQQPNTQLATIAFQPDGRPHLLDETIAGAIYLGLGPNPSDAEFEIEISPIGAITKKKLR